MTKALATTNFDERVALLVDDWKGQDEMFYHDRALRTIVWYVGKVKSLEGAYAEIRSGEKTRFMAAVAQGYGMDLRRLQEAVAVYKKFSKPSDSLKETCERIFQEAGSWSRALPQKPEKQLAEPSCSHCKQHCPNHDKDL
jgi:hypothetical protein